MMAVERVSESLPEPGPRLREARKIIEREYARLITTQRIARRLRLSRLALHKAFLASFGMTPECYLRYCRAQQAARLLAQGSSIHDTALLVGYSSPQRFVADYRREFRSDAEQLCLLARHR